MSKSPPLCLGRSGDRLTVAHSTSAREIAEATLAQGHSIILGQQGGVSNRAYEVGSSKDARPELGYRSEDRRPNLVSEPEVNLRLI